MNKTLIVIPERDRLHQVDKLLSTGNKLIIFTNCTLIKQTSPPVAILKCSSDKSNPLVIISVETRVKLEPTA